MLHPKIKDYVKRVLIVVPKNVVLNWFKEFQKWLDDNDPELASIEVNHCQQFLPLSIIMRLVSSGDGTGLV